MPTAVQFTYVRFACRIFIPLLLNLFLRPCL